MYLESVYLIRGGFPSQMYVACPATTAIATIVAAGLSDMFDKTEKRKKNQGISLALSEI